MNTPRLKSDWKAISDKLKQTWPALTDEDLQYTEGSEEALFAHIQKRTDATRHDIENAIAEI